MKDSELRKMFVDNLEHVIVKKVEVFDTFEYIRMHNSSGPGEIYPGHYGGEGCGPDGVFCIDVSCWQGDRLEVR